MLDFFCYNVQKTSDSYKVQKTSVFEVVHLFTMQCFLDYDAKKFKVAMNEIQTRSNLIFGGLVLFHSNSIPASKVNYLLGKR